MATVTLYDLDGQRHELGEVRQVAVLNNESFTKDYRNLTAGDGGRTLILNINGISAALVNDE